LAARFTFSWRGRKRVLAGTSAATTLPTSPPEEHGTATEA
jgi:hypothetical protein